MGRTRYIYREEDGLVCAFPMKAPNKGTPNELNGSFHERVKRAYYEVECNGQLRGPYPKNMIRRVHDTAIARGE